MERQMQAILDRLDNLVNSRSQRRQSAVDSRQPSREATRETKVNFSEPTDGRRTNGTATSKGGSSQYTIGTHKPTILANGHRAKLSGHALSMGSRPMRNSSATGKDSSTAGTHSNKRRPNQGNPSNRANTGPEMTDQPNNYDRAGSTQDTTVIATAFVPLT